MARRIRSTFVAVCLTIAASAALATLTEPADAAVPAARAQVATTGAFCDVTFTVFAQWSTGYVAGVTVRNISTVPVRWRLVLTFPGPVVSMQVWNATVTQTGSVATIIPVPPNDILQPGQSVMVGFFNATGGVVTLPTSVVTCTPV